MNETEELLKGLLTSEQAADYLGVTRSWINMLAKNELIPAIQVGKKMYLFKPADLDKYRATRGKAGWPKGKPRKPKDEQEAQNG